jgi:malyl-CoA/(S)-citramalyl-CoA lyase
VLTDKDGDKRQYFWTDPWHAAQTRMLVACRAYGLRPIDGPFGDFSDPDGFIAAANRAAVLGYEGKWAIHPSQIELANQVFTPSAADVTKARRILAAMAQAAKEGRGAVSLDGRLIDIASIRMAEALIAKAALEHEHQASRQRAHDTDRANLVQYLDQSPEHALK